MTRKASDEGAATPSIAEQARELVPLSLPSSHISHSGTLENEMQNRAHQFRSGIIALQGEMEGQQKAYEATIKELTDKHNVSKADLLRRIADLEKGQRAVAKALDTLAEPEN